MNKIELKEEQIERICESIAEVYINYRYDQNVECIYFAPYTDFYGQAKESRPNGNAIEITVVTTNEPTKEEEKFIKNFNRLCQTKKFEKENGIGIKIELDEAINYSTIAMHSYEERRQRNLLNSQILLDKTGNYQRIQSKVKEFNKNGTLESYKNIAEIIPPIDNKLDIAIEIKQGEVDLEAIKEFAVTPLFEYIKELK